MQLIGKPLYYKVALKALEETIIPELQSPSALAAGAFVLDAIRAVARREDEGGSLLERRNLQAMDIAASLEAALTAHGVPLPARPTGARSDAVGFEPLAVSNGELTRWLAELVNLFAQSVPFKLRNAGDLALLRQAAEWECQTGSDFAAVPAPPAGNESTEPPLRDALTAFIRSGHHDADAVTITHLQRAAGGFGKQTYLLEIKDGSGALEKLVVRKEDPAPICDHPSFDLEREFHLVSAVNRSGYRAPLPLWFSRKSPGIDAPFYVMKALTGKAAGSFLEGANRIPESLALEFAELLAKLHQIPLESLSEVIARFEDPSVLTETIAQGYRRHIASWRDYVRTARTLPSPLLAYLFDWLETHVPEDTSRPVLVHGDYSIHNILIDDDHITGVLDWEAAMFGAPGIDLAYVRLGLAKHIDWSTFVEHYRRCGGRHVDDATLDYHLTFQAVKIMVAMIRAHYLLHSETLTDIRLTIFELGLVPQFMKMALSTTS
ncbi:phosphotransferase [Hydrocarboniphaga sp.]|uniref:phosphotransferase n=1 Tax=Hydrocarboniphaga sp. TaxID=2033016 RepID=UPI003D141DC1